MIKNRPKQLEDIPYYKHLPRAPFRYDPSALPLVLNFDIYDTCGLLPITTEVSNHYGEYLTVQPPEEVVNYYYDKNINVQMVSIVANFYDLQLDNGTIVGKPYCISLVPATKRGKLDPRSVKLVQGLKLEEMENFGGIYLGFNPFDGGYGLFGSYSTLMGENGINSYTDSIGFVVNAYFLADQYEKDQVMLPNIVNAPLFIQEKYTKYRINHYFKQFKNTKPRKIWGADSPIELFLIQALAARSLYPQIQTLIFESGDVFPSFYEMIEEQNLTKETALITEVDLYFPDKKIAIFCDSTQHHRSNKARKKDERITNKLQEIGIRSIRVKGSNIVKNLNRTVNEIIEQLS
jgi:hypothetical protein